MKKIIVLLYIFYTTFVYSQQQNTDWLNFPVSKKNEFIGKLNENYYMVFLTKENKIIQRKFNLDLKSFEDQVLNIKVNKNTFYLKSVIINNQITHLISHFDSEDNKIKLWAYVQKQSNSSEFEKYILNESNYTFGKSWLYDMSGFSQHDFQFSPDKSKFYVQQKDFSNPIIFKSEEKTINVFDTKDLTKPINSYLYSPERMYYDNNGIKVLNNGSICKSDSYRLEDLITKKKSNYRYKLKHKGINSKNTKLTRFISEDSTITGLNFDEYDSKIYANGIKFESNKRKSHVFNNIYSSDNFKLIDSTCVEIPEVLENEHVFAHTILTSFTDKSNNLFFITSQIERTKNNSYIDYKIITVYSLDSTTKELKTITKIPIKFEIQNFRNDYSFDDISNPLLINYSENGIDLLFKDFTENDNAINYQDYIKYKNTKNISLIYIQIDTKGKITKKKLINESEEKRSIDYKRSKFIDSNLIYLEDSKNRKFNIIKL